MAGSMGAIGGLGRDEMLALIELQQALVRLLPPIDMARIYLAAWPYGLGEPEGGHWQAGWLAG